MGPNPYYMSAIIELDILPRAILEKSYILSKIDAPYALDDGACFFSYVSDTR